MRRTINKFRASSRKDPEMTIKTTTTMNDDEVLGAGGTVRELIMVYDADGSISGELIYITKKLLGFGHCAACDISHGSRREKPEFTALKQKGWGVPLRNIHRDEMDDVLDVALRGHLPCIAARLVSGQVVLLVGNEQLNKCSGDVPTFRAAVDGAIEKENLIMPPPSNACTLPPSSPTTTATNTTNDEAIVPDSSTGGQCT